jgi:hypothetical protein
MFTADPNITDLQVKEKVISRLFFSLNAPQIATPELSVEEARCYVLFFRAGNSYTAYIGLYLPNSDRRFYYAYSGNPVPEQSVNEALDEATRFAEEMGFLLDELKLAVMSVDERNQWIEDQAIFGYKTRTEEKPVGKVEAKPAEQPALVEQKTVAPAPEKPKEALTPPPEPAAAVQPETSPLPAMQPAPAQKKTAPAKPQAAVPQKAPVPEAAAARVQEQEEAVQPAAKAAPAKPRAKKAPSSPTGTVSREFEALARLLASF